MKIILDNEEEKEEFLRMCMYIHDFSVFFRKMRKRSYIDIIRSFDNSIPGERIKDFKQISGVSLDLDMFPHLNILAGLHDCEEELKEEVHNRYIEVLDKDEIEDEFLRDSILEEEK